MTFTAAINPIIDAVLALITVPSGWTKVSTGASPERYAPQTLYCWPIAPQQSKPAGMDNSVHAEIWFYLRLAWSVGTDEAKGMVRLRSTSDAIDAGLVTIETAILGNPSSAVWEGIQIDRTDSVAATTFDERVGFADVSGYRIV